MGVYNIETIYSDFLVSAKGHDSETLHKLVDVAKRIIREMPDNQPRDMCISDLLHAASWLPLIKIYKPLEPRKID